MREIKFRVFSPDWGGYVPYKNNADLFSELEEGQDDCVVIEQYTGLKDKNGVEIYAGDIVNFSESTKLPMVVRWCDSDACFEMQGGDYQSNCFTPSIMVIGSIHENPELLES